MKNKKSLGQNFLISNEVVDIIIETANLNKEDIVLEIGPGKGFLTEKILKKSKKVIVVEKDDRLIPFLKEKFKKEIKEKKLIVINDDILDFNFNKILLNFSKNKKNILNYKIVANIPYYITGQIIKKFLSTEEQPKRMVLMLQKEVAKRITDEKGSLLALSIKVYGDPQYIETVKAKNFLPKPKVDSAILLIDNISKSFFKKNKIEEESFFNLIRLGFSHKRKILINNLKLNKNITEKKDKKEIEKIFKKLNINLRSRAEDLKKQDWKNILIYNI